MRHQFMAAAGFTTRAGCLAIVILAVGIFGCQREAPGMAGGDAGVVDGGSDGTAPDATMLRDGNTVDGPVNGILCSIAGRPAGQCPLDELPCCCPTGDYYNSPAYCSPPGSCENCETICRDGGCTSGCGLGLVTCSSPSDMCPPYIPYCCLGGDLIMYCLPYGPWCGFNPEPQGANERYHCNSCSECPLDRPYCCPDPVNENRKMCFAAPTGSQCDGP